MKSGLFTIFYIRKLDDGIPYLIPKSRTDSIGNKALSKFIDIACINRNSRRSNQRLRILLHHPVKRREIISLKNIGGFLRNACKSVHNIIRLKYNVVVIFDRAKVIQILWIFSTLHLNRIEREAGYSVSVNILVENGLS